MHRGGGHRAEHEGVENGRRPDAVSRPTYGREGCAVRFPAGGQGGRARQVDRHPAGQHVRARGGAAPSSNQVRPSIGLNRSAPRSRPAGHSGTPRPIRKAWSKARFHAMRRRGPAPSCIVPRSGRFTPCAFSSAFGQRGRGAGRDRGIKAQDRAHRGASVRGSRRPSRPASGHGRGGGRGGGGDFAIRSATGAPSIRGRRRTGLPPPRPASSPLRR